jgi:hypothetical protein
VPRAIVHRVTYCVMAAGGRQPAVHEDDHPFRHALDLVQHVRADDDSPALRPESLEQRDEVHPLYRISTVQRLVEHEHLWILDECGRDLGALTHPLAERIDAPVGGVEHRDLPQRVVGRVPVDDAMQVGDVTDELSRREPGGHRFVLGDERHPTVDGAVPTRVVPLDAHRALVDAHETGHGPHQRRLAGAVGPQQTGHTRTERTTELGQRDFRSEPHRHLDHLHGGVDGECRVTPDGRWVRPGDGHQRSTQR